MPPAKSKPAKKGDGNAEVLEKVAAMPQPFRDFGERIHAIMLKNEPPLTPKLFYGMPGYTNGGPIICFFRVDGDLMTFGVTEKAHHSVEKGAASQLMGSAWFLRDLDEATEKEIAAIVHKAAS